MAEERPKQSESTDELEQEEIDGQTAEELPEREVMTVLEPMNPLAPVGGEVIQPPPPDN
jgi:hypothetical protein